LTAYTNGNSWGLYKSTDGGVSWNLINGSVASSSNYACYNRICKVSPVDPTNVFCGGLNMEHSVNGGTSFSTSSTYHVDHHALFFAPSNPSYVVAGEDGGVNYSTDGGNSWTRSSSLPITQFYAGDIDYNNPNVMLGGAQDNGTPRTLSGNQNDWTDITGGDGFYCLVDYTNSQRVYGSTQNGALERSTNGGTTFTYGTSGLDLTYTNWMTPYVMDKTNPLTMYCGTYKIFKTTNGMQSWSAISPDMTNGHIQNLGTITTVDVSKSNPNVIYCGTDDANVWVTTNSGTNWIKINTGLPYNWVTRVAVPNDSANVCYVTLSGYKVDSLGIHVFRTSNYGSSWVPISGNLPNAPANDIVIDPQLIGTLYLATDVGVMVTTNYGTNWSLLATGIPSDVPCHELTLHVPTRKLVVWTHGRSAFALQLPPLAVKSDNEIVRSFALQQNFPNPFNPVTKIKFSIPAGGNSAGLWVRLDVYNSAGQRITELINENLKPGNYEANWNAADNPSGAYFYRLVAGNYSASKKMILLK